MQYLYRIILISFFLGCDTPLPKPKAMLRLEYPTAIYKSLDAERPYDFLVNKISHVSYKKEALQIYYKPMKATIYINYRKIKNNLEALLRDAQKLTFEHVIKADNISEKIYKNKKRKVYGTLYTISGNAASQVQFYLTDSINNFMLGALYFYAEPNYDSIYPGVKYLSKDIYKIIESLTWKNPK